MFTDEDVREHGGPSLDRTQSVEKTVFFNTLLILVIILCYGRAYKRQLVKR